MRLHTKDTSWTLDPRIEIPEKENKEGIKRGIGNQVTVEFNLLYRFHSPLSKRDSNWIDDQAEAMKKMMHGPRGNSGNAKPQPAYISYARNNATGKYDDDKLVEHLVESIEDPICTASLFSCLMIITLLLSWKIDPLIKDRSIWRNEYA